MIRKFSFCAEDVKCGLFRAFCYSLYVSSLRSQLRASRVQKLKVLYNTIFTKLLKIPSWVSPHAKYVQCRVLSFGEIWWKKLHSLRCRIKDSNNYAMETLMKSDVTSFSCILDHYWRFLYVSPGGPIFVS